MVFFTTKSIFTHYLQTIMKYDASLGLQNPSYLELYSQSSIYDQLLKTFQNYDEFEKKLLMAILDVKTLGLSLRSRNCISGIWQRHHIYGQLENPLVT